MNHEYGIGLFDHHAALLRDSAITVEVARERRYRTADQRKQLGSLGFSSGQQQVPGLLLPVYGETGEITTYQFRPDEPRLTRTARKPVKYETPARVQMAVDVPPRVQPYLADPGPDLWLTEGVRKADAAVSAGLHCLALLGVWNWRGANEHGGKTALAFWESVALNGRTVYVCFDSDVMVKSTVHAALVRLGAFLSRRGATVRYIYLPDADGKVGLDDYLAAGGSVADLLSSARSDPAKPEPEAASEAEPEATNTATHQPLAEPVALADALRTFRRWLHLEDDAPVLTVAATMVANLAPGDPVWLLLVAPPSAGKTEVLGSVAGLDYVHSIATVTESSLLSGTSARERGKHATGGVLRQLGNFGILLCKDFTSVLSQNGDTRNQALAALREIYDGAWDRAVGTDGGRVLRWHGKAGLVGGVTPSLDHYNSVVGALGDRYLLLRLRDIDPLEMGARALDHLGAEHAMRKALAQAMTGLIAGADRSAVTRPLAEDERDRIVALAAYTARARTAVERDGYSQEVLVMPQPEGTGRLVLQLRRLYGGLEAIGVDEPRRWDIVGRVASDCVPAVRTALSRTLLSGVGARRTSEIAADADMVTKTAHRRLEDMTLLKLAVRSKHGEAENSADLWRASDWLRAHWPGFDRESETDFDTPLSMVGGKGAQQHVDDTDTPSPSRQDLSHHENGYAGGVLDHGTWQRMARGYDT